ncbi:MAG: alpha/beta fold hydrolase [Halioglobus sp.]
MFASSRVRYLCLILILGSPASFSQSVASTECVVLLHGLFRSAFAMKPLEWRLEHAGYSVVNESYDSTSLPIEELARVAVGQGISDCHARGLDRTHFVTHSLGGVLVREYARTNALPASTRVVMLGPPNQGSQVAGYYGSLGLWGEFKPPVIDQLGENSQALVERLGPVSFQLGVIAGNLRNSTLIPGFPDQPSDGTVTVAETVVPGMMDFLQMPALHTFMIWNPLVWNQTEQFLRFGQFKRDK